jgi:hypothetical protein
LIRAITVKSTMTVSMLSGLPPVRKSCARPDGTITAMPMAKPITRT